MKSFSRRDMLRFGAAGLGSLLVPSGMRTIASAAEGVAGPEANPSPVKKNHKINPPASGCYVGFWTEWERAIFYEGLRPARPAFDRARSLEERVQLQASIQTKFDPVSIASMKKDVEGYEKDMGVKPYFSVNRNLAKIWTPFPTSLSIGMKQLGLVPVLYAALESGDQHYTPQMDDIVKGKFDREIARYAKGAHSFGEAYGSFFITTMHEPNVPRVSGVRHWVAQKDRSPDTYNKTWRHIWNIFRDEGANEYATWEIVYWTGGAIGDYYPGDEYVDWIGLEIQNWWSQGFHKQGPYRSLDEIMSRSYEYVAAAHKDKPIILSEVSSETHSKQHEWYKDAFQSIKAKPKIGALIIIDVPLSDYSFGYDLQLTSDSKKVLREALKDPYWILAR